MIEGQKINHEMRRIAGLLFCIVLCQVGFAQNSDLKIGEWKSHLPYNDGRYITQSDTDIFIATTLSIIIVSKDDESVSYLDKVNGLNDIGMGIIKYNEENDVLVATYLNSNIDLIFEDRIVNISDIERANNIQGDRTIYDIYFDGPFAYIAAGYGLSKFNLQTLEFEFSTFTSDNAVRGVTIYNDNIYIATDDGLLRIAKDNPNPAVLGLWEFVGSEVGLPMDYSSVAIKNYDNALYFDVSGVLYKMENGQASLFHDEEDHSIRYISGEGERLIVGYCFTADCDKPNGTSGRTRGKTLFFKDGTIKPSGDGCASFPIYSIEDERGYIWYIDEWRSIRYTTNADLDCDKLDFNSPYSQNSTDLAVWDNQLWVASGGISASESYLWRSHGFFSLIDGEWTTYSLRNQNDLSGLYDFYSIAAHPETGTVFSGSYLDGLVEYDRTDFTVYNELNSSLQTVPDDPGRSRVSGMAFDNENNLWVSNHSAPNPLSVFRNNGSTKNFSTSNNKKNLLHMDVDDFGNKWIVVGGNQGGVLVFNEMDIDNDFDDEDIFFNSSNSNIPTTKVNCLAVDLEGDVWVGTNEGVVVFECGSNIFQGECRGTRRIVEQNGFLNYLLVAEDVKAIAVDGANRKWFGTTNGIFVQSSNGEQQVAFFNEDNSPLFDNTITSIAINDENGEVFIGTNNGIISYRSDAVKGSIVNSNDIYAFPNPVQPDYNGPIAIKGLASNANVKITDTNGVLVYETEALGGQAIWNGTDYNGRRAASGVYLVFSTGSNNFEEPEAVVAKILFIN